MAVHDCFSVYHVPFLMESQGLVKILEEKLKLTKPLASPYCTTLVTKWKEITERERTAFDETRICLVGKYTHLQDSYLSVVKGLKHASLSCHRKLVIDV